jgi:hypothetical protein
MSENKVSFLPFPLFFFFSSLSKVLTSSVQQTLGKRKLEEEEPEKSQKKQRQNEDHETDDGQDQIRVVSLFSVCSFHLMLFSFAERAPFLNQSPKFHVC